MATPGFTIYGARISSEGRVIDSVGVFIHGDIAEDPDRLYYSDIALTTSGNNSLILGSWWPSVGGPSAGITGRRIARNMRVLDSIPIEVSTSGSPFLATFGGGYYFVVWDASNSLYGRRITEGGVLVDSQPLFLYTSQEPLGFQLTSDGNNYLLVTTEFERLFGILINNQGQVIDTFTIFRVPKITNSSSSEIGLTYGNNYYFVSFYYLDSIYGVRIRTDGIVIDTTPIGIASLPVLYYNRLNCAYGNGVYLVNIAFRDDWNRVLYFKRISTDGQVLDTSLIPIFHQFHIYEGSDEEFSPSSAFDGNNFIVVWEDYDWDSGPFAEKYIRYSLVTPGGRVINPGGVILSTAMGTEKSQDAAFDSHNYLVVWTDNRSISETKSDIYGQILNPNGTNVVSSFPICRHRASQSGPRVCFGRENYLVVWCDNRSGSSGDIYGQIVTPTGQLPDTLGIPIIATPADESQPDVAWDGKNFLVVCSHLLTGRIFGARVSSDGMLLDSIPFMINDTFPRANNRGPAVVSNGENSLVVWRRHRPGEEANVWGAFVNKYGQVLNHFQISFVERLENISHRMLGVTTNGSDYFVTWFTYGLNFTRQTFGARVSQEGIVLDSPSIYLGSGKYPAVTFDGRNYILLRRRDENRLNISFINQEGVPQDTNGTDIIETPFPLITRVNRITKGPSDQCLVTFVTFTSEPYNTQRVYGAFFNSSGLAENSKQSLPSLSFSLFPTITRSTLLLDLAMNEKGKVMLKIYGIDGRLIKNNLSINLGELNPGKHRLKLCLASLPSGVYFLKIEPGKVIKKFIIAR